MSNNSDYKKPRTNLYDLLPEVYKSDTNRAIFENLFNRFLTKQETTKVSGYIGKGNPEAIVKRQVREFDVHRQGYQLQPILYNKVGSVEHMASWVDLLNEAERLGIDPERMQDWLGLLQFNWAPPIDPDKFIHYLDYYWYDPDNLASKPQYITIRSRCATTEALVNFRTRLVEEFGAVIPITGILPVDDTPPSFSIVSGDGTLDILIVIGDVRDDLGVGSFFSIGGTTIADGVYQVSGGITYDDNTNRSTIPVATLDVTFGALGYIKPRKYDKLVVTGDYARLFTPGFVFMFISTANQELGNKFHEVVDSNYNEQDAITVIQINTVFSNDAAVGDISQQELLDAAYAARDCQCGGSVGFDAHLYDDNPDTPIWDGLTGYGNLETFLAAIKILQPSPGDGELWWNEADDELQQYSASLGGWKIIWTNFSLLVEQTLGVYFYDYTLGCGIQSRVAAADQWIENNKWIHRNDVPNFAVAKQAKAPIIEFEWDLELNEWTYTTYVWKYRAQPTSNFKATTNQPTRLELEPVEWSNVDTSVFTIDSKYGDLTEQFYPGMQFSGEGASDIFVVDYSYFKIQPGGLPTTVVVPTTPIVGSDVTPSTPLHPLRTSQGDIWKGYGQHWLFVGVDETLPVYHQPEHPHLSTTLGVGTGTGYTYTYGYYFQENIISETSPASTIILHSTLQNRVLVGYNDIRVYVDEERQYGTYDELQQTSPNEEYVYGISFLPGYEPSPLAVVRIEVGEATQADTGLSVVPVRTIEDNALYAGQDVLVSLIQYRKEEQVKTSTNQYPLFDIYNVDGTSAFQANTIFKYKTSISQPINEYIGERTVTDTDATDYVFEQFLVEEDSGVMYAYRDYKNQVDSIWVNPQTQKVYFWNDLTWDEYTTMNQLYAKAVVSDAEPQAPWNMYPGVYWYDTNANQLKILISPVDPGPTAWEVVDARFATSDPTIQTIWKKGLNDEIYVPQKRDWEQRSLEEYNNARDVYIEEKSEELILANPSLNVAEVVVQATDEWNSKQANQFNTDPETGTIVIDPETGAWRGDWEIPDPLYYNHNHENRKEVTFRELLTHYNSIIEAQPQIPGFSGLKETMFHLIPINDVNYGLGGTIKEFNYSFDTFLSSLFVNNISPRALVDFAQDQYEILLNGLKETFRRRAFDIFSDMSIDSILNPSTFASQLVIESHEANEQLNKIYGDSTTFTDVIGGTDLGIRNWIVTLPYLGLLEPTVPVKVTDDQGLNDVVHHDGHRSTYNLVDAVTRSIITQLAKTLDPRASNSFILESGANTPPATSDEFETYFGTSLTNREGVYWNDTTPGSSTLYRLVVAESGAGAPASSLPDGTKWIDLRAGVECLRSKVTNSNTGVAEWIPVDGAVPGDSPVIIEAAWEVVDFNDILTDVILAVEKKLYENVPTYPLLKYDFDHLRDQYSQLVDEYLEQSFYSYMTEREIVAPMDNTDYDPTDPFTWNYAYSTIPVGQIPSSTNTGDETGGDWRDLYQKLFGTPYPHREPWVLQGYANKPEWWDDYYLNDDPRKWGDRVWKYRHGFEIIAANPTENSFTIEGDFREVFPTSLSFTVYNQAGVYAPVGHISRNPIHDGTWEVRALTSISNVSTGTVGTSTIEVPGDLGATFYPGMKFVVTNSSNDIVAYHTVLSSVHITFPSSKTIIVVEEAIISGVGYVNVGGATYNGDTNQLTIRLDTGGSPATSLITSTAAVGRIQIRYGMWENIRVGIIPEGKKCADGIVSTGYPQTCEGIPTYNHFCVNIDNVTINDGSGDRHPDDLLPPKWTFNAAYTADPSWSIGSQLSFDHMIDSIYPLLGLVVSPGADYSFGDAGTIEWEWRNSSQFLYDLLTVAFRIDPVRFMHSAFGENFIEVAGLMVDTRTRNVFSHIDTKFHGDVSGNAQLKFNGMNQWYVNFARYNGLDISMSDFRSMWTNWTAPMMYQFSSFIDTPSLDLAHRVICLSEYDYRVASKRSAGVEDYWMESFDIYTLSIPPKTARYDNEFEWKFELHTKTTSQGTIPYYDVQKYQFHVDPDTDLCTLYRWEIRSLSISNKAFEIDGDYTDIFVNGRTLVVSGSTANNGTYTVTSSAYSQPDNRTIIKVEQTIPSNVKDGLLTLNYRTLPWETGENIILSTTSMIPSPLQIDNINGVYQYFIIVSGPTTFRLARTKNDAYNGNYIDITSRGKGDQFVAKLLTTFETSRASVYWKHYALDTSTIRTITPPTRISGFQGVIDFIDGYSAYVHDQGWRINEDNTLKDPTNTSLSVSWQLEVQRWIEYNYVLRSQKTKRGEMYSVVVNPTSDVWSIVDGSKPQYITGDPIAIFSPTRDYPPPLVHGGRYYIIRDTSTTFRLARTKNDAQEGIAIDIDPTISATTWGELFLMDATSLTELAPKFEVNPFRNAIWFRPERGIVSNVLTGPSEDIYNTQLVVDQYSRPLGRKALRIYREDQITKVRVADEIQNDIELTKVFQDPYNYIHIGAAHLFVDTYEHVLIFNNNTSEGTLLYDPFVGLNVTKFELLFNRQTEFTQRPNVGGQYLQTFYNQGADLNRNIEASIDDIRYLYDTYQVIEANPSTIQSRKVLGYDGDLEYLRNINLTTKSQFAYWRGQIQAKGSTRTIQAFINSRRFIDAKVDEFWAFKIATFGSNAEKEYLEMWLKSSDSRLDDLRLQFIGEDDLCNSGYSANQYDSSCGFAYPETGLIPVATAQTGFQPVIITDTSRWFNQPDQAAKLLNNGGTMYFDLRLVPESATEIVAGEVVMRTNEIGQDEYFFRHNGMSDMFTITGRLASPSSVNPEDTGGGYCENVEVPISATPVTEITLQHMEYIPFTGMIDVFISSDAGITYTLLAPNVDYVEIAGSGNFLSNTLQFGDDVSGKFIRVVPKTATLQDGIHYEYYTSNIIKLKYTEIWDGTLLDATVWGWRLDKESLNPHKIIDVVSETVITPIQVWDPARGYHYHVGIHAVDLENDNDPAFYNVTEVTDQVGAITITDLYNPGDILQLPWGKSQVGTTWLDTSKLEYVPYFDRGSIPTLDDRLREWGQLTDWGQVKIYTWVESDVPPEDWNAVAEVEEIDTTINQKVRKSGRTFTTTFENVGSQWVAAQNKRMTFDLVIDGTVVSSPEEMELTTTGIDLDNARVFVNGRLITDWYAASANTIHLTVFNLTDRVDVIEFVVGDDPTLDDATNEENLNAAIEAGTHRQGYQYVVDEYKDRLDQTKFRYYFWVENKSTKGSKSTSPRDAQTSLEVIPIPYVLYDRPVQAGSITFNGQLEDVPARFTQVVVRGIREIVGADNRYILRWTRDFTLRDSLEYGKTPLEKKNLHEEWTLLRKEQPFSVPRWLWNRIIESIVGYKLSNPSIRVPSLERTLYDLNNGTDTQYGLKDGQTFVDGALALSTILSDLNNVNNDFTPVDINVFFQNYNFDTPENIIEAMNTVYETFPYLHINRIFFEVLHDAFSTKRKYEDIFKTSMIAVHGIKPFQVGGLFDD